MSCRYRAGRTSAILALDELLHVGFYRALLRWYRAIRSSAAIRFRLDFAQAARACEAFAAANAKAAALAFRIHPRALRAQGRMLVLHRFRLHLNVNYLHARHGGVRGR